MGSAYTFWKVLRLKVWFQVYAYASFKASKKRQLADGET